MTSQIVTSVGRIVWGNPATGLEKKKNNQPVIKDGKTVIEYAFGLAIPKDQFVDVGAAMQAEAAAVFPQGVPQDFSFKTKDGDTDKDGKDRPLCDKVGYAGCYVIACSTEFPIPVFKKNAAGKFAQLQANEIKTGDFVRVQLTINGHGRAPGVTGSKPGLYLNPSMVEHVGYGEEIRGQADPDGVFGGEAPLPAGASATPVASGPPPSAPQAPQSPAAPSAPHGSFPWGPKS